jgi:hypothetical protein
MKGLPSKFRCFRLMRRMVNTMQTTLNDPSQLAFYRRTFNRQLEPIKVMLVNRKHDLDHDHWLALIHKTRASIFNHPDQYVVIDELPINIAQSVVTRIFDEFISQVVSQPDVNS